MRTSNFGSNREPRTFREVLQDQTTLSKLAPESVPEFDVMSDGGFFIRTSKMTGEKMDKSMTRFILFDRRVTPIFGFTADRIPISDGLIICAVSRRLGNSSGVSTGFNRFQFQMANSNSDHLLYFAPLNEIVVTTDYQYTFDVKDAERNYGQNMFRERSKIMTIGSEYWNYTMGEMNEVSRDNQIWYQQNYERIAQLLSGIGDSNSEISYLVGQFENN